jgi:DNA-binding NarL/FixJ family response regulator
MMCHFPKGIPLMSVVMLRTVSCVTPPQTGLRRVLLADEEPMFLEGLRGLCAHDGLAVAAVTSHGSEVVPLVARERPDVAVVGTVVSPFGSLEAVRQIVQISPGTRVLLLTSLLDERRLADAWQAGARGVAPRYLLASELLFAILEIAAGRTYVWRSDQNIPVRWGTAGTAVTSLSSREYDVLRLIADGKSLKQIAAMLGIAPKTVEHHRAHICRKLAVQTTAHLVRCAVRLGLVEA